MENIKQKTEEIIKLIKELPYGELGESLENNHLRDLAIEKYTEGLFWAEKI